MSKNKVNTKEVSTKKENTKDVNKIDVNKIEDTGDINKEMQEAETQETQDNNGIQENGIATDEDIKEMNKPLKGDLDVDLDELRVKYTKKRGQKDVKDLLVLRIGAKRILEKYSLYEDLKTLTTKEEKAKAINATGFDLFETSVIIGVTEAEAKKMINGTTRKVGEGSNKKVIALPEIPQEAFSNGQNESARIVLAVNYLWDAITIEHPEIANPEETFGFNTWIDKALCHYDTGWKAKQDKSRKAAISVVKQKITLERNAII